MSDKARLIGAAVLCVLLVGCGEGASSEPDEAEDSPTTPAAITVTGTMLVPPPLFSEELFAPCTSREGYEDIAAGSQVVISDQDGRTVGIGSLDAGVLQPGKVLPELYRCEYSFTVIAEPGGDFYAIAIGGPQRGSVEFTAEQLTAPVELSLGD